MSISIRPFQGSDLPGLVTLWNRTHFADPISEQRVLLDFILDPNFDPLGLLIACDGRNQVGFVLGMASREDRPSDNLYGSGIVVGIGVEHAYRRQGIASQLLARLEEHWHQRNVTNIQVGPWVPTYLTPGVDETSYPGAVDFFAARGYMSGARPISMRASLTGYAVAEGIEEIVADLDKGGISIRPAIAEDALPLLRFAAEHFPHWESYVRGNLRALVAASDGSTLTVAIDAGKIIGFALTNGERFGPFGVDEAYRGRGVGAVLLSRSLQAMRARAIHTAYFLWTSDQTARLYRRHGFEMVRRFTMMKKTLKEGP